MVLKKRKQYEAQLKNYMTHQFTLNQVAFTSENIQNTLEMVLLFFISGPNHAVSDRSAKISDEKLGSGQTG
jgi:hypothetical protein